VRGRDQARNGKRERERERKAERERERGRRRWREGYRETLASVPCSEGGEPKQDALAQDRQGTVTSTMRRAAHVFGWLGHIN